MYCERHSTAPIVNSATGDAASASRPMVCPTGFTGTKFSADAAAPSRIDHGIGLSAMPLSAFMAATSAP